MTPPFVDSTSISYSSLSSLELTLVIGLSVSSVMSIFFHVLYRADKVIER